MAFSSLVALLDNMRLVQLSSDAFNLCLSYVFLHTLYIVSDFYIANYLYFIDIVYSANNQEVSFLLKSQLF